MFPDTEEYKINIYYVKYVTKQYLKHAYVISSLTK